MGHARGTRRDQPGEHRSRWAALGGGGAIGLIALAVALVACPAKELMIEISARGASFVVGACGQSCEDDCCALGTGTKPDGYSPDIQVQLHLLPLPEDASSAADFSVEAQSTCVSLTGKCDETVPDFNACVAMQLNQALSQAMAEGVSFDGLTDPDDAVLVLSFHYPGAGGSACAAADLFACAGLTETHEDVWDITCASCVGGSPELTYQQSGLVPPCFGRCFVEECYQVLLRHEQGG